MPNDDSLCLRLNRVVPIPVNTSSLMFLGSYCRKISTFNFFQLLQQNNSHDDKLDDSPYIWIYSLVSIITFKYFSLYLMASCFWFELLFWSPSLSPNSECSILNSQSKIQNLYPLNFYCQLTMIFETKIIKRSCSNWVQFD